MKGIGGRCRRSPPVQPADSHEGRSSRPGTKTEPIPGAFLVARVGNWQGHRSNRTMRSSATSSLNFSVDRSGIQYHAGGDGGRADQHQKKGSTGWRSMRPPAAPLRSPPQTRQSAPSDPASNRPGIAFFWSLDIVLRAVPCVLASMSGGRR